VLFPLWYSDVLCVVDGLQLALARGVEIRIALGSLLIY